MRYITMTAVRTQVTSNIGTIESNDIYMFPGKKLEEVGFLMNRSTWIIFLTWSVVMIFIGMI
jgi:hypothetical protein